MALVQRFDVSKLSRVQKTGAGGARVPASVARTGIQEYRDSNGRLVREYRSPEVVFDAAALASLASVPVTIGHPGSVDARNWRHHAVGHTTDAAPTRRADGGVEWVDSEIVVQDADALRRIEAGELVEISMGYVADVVHEPGVTPSGERYDAVQRGIKFNHLALLGSGKARAGSGARLRLDGNEEPCTNEENMKVKIDGIEYDFGSPSHVQALEKQRDVASARADKAEADLVAASAEAGKAKAKSDAQDAELVALKARDVNALVTEELAFRTRVTPALPKGYDFSGKSRAQVRADALGGDVVAKADALPEGQREGYLTAHLELKLDAASKPAPVKAETHTVKADATPEVKPAPKKNPIVEAYNASWSK